MKKNFHKGISIVEILIVVAILGLIVAVALPRFSRYRELQVLNGAVGDVVSGLHKAQTETLGSVGSTSYGVHLEAARIIIFQGTSYSAGDPQNETISFSEPAAISNVTLGGISASTGNLYFNRLSGAPSSSGTVTVSTPSYSKIITIAATGAVHAN